MPLADEVIDLCRAQGFALAGVCPLAPPAHAEALREWLAAGKQGEMTWLADTLEARLDPTSLLPGAKSAVMVADLYATRGQNADEPAPGEGKVARYARARDYHQTVKTRLHRVCDELRARHPGSATRAFADTAPILERDLAAACGLGWIGKHTLLINPALGSWFVLGGFLTTLDIEPPARQPAVPDHCGTCTRCIDACPTDAITPYSVDATRCISYLTIEHESPIDPGLAAQLGGWFVGCDICQEVCPHNSPRSSGGGAAPRPEYEPTRSRFDLLRVLGWDETTRRARFASSAMKRITLAQAKRNAIELLAAECERTPALTAPLLARLSDLAWDASEHPDTRALAGRLIRQLRPET